MTDALPDLPDLTPAEADLVARWPLPEGQPDAIVNKAQLSVALDVSETTLTTWLRRPDDPLPVARPGANGRSYEFRLSVAHAWFLRMRNSEDAAKAHGDRAAAQLQLALLGGDSASPQDGKLSLTDQRRLLELELVRTQAARQRGELIREADVVALFEDYNATIRDSLEAAPDRIARELGLDGAAIELIQSVLDGALASAERAAREVLGDD
ncbi:terminase small subunit [Dinoroseobacter phage vB_DshS-R4C]|nr:terminase small subunit [Dinoroseobacter phage vB_DshS-R4C]